MHIGTQLYAPDGYDTLSKDVTYHLLRSDVRRQRTLLVEFRSVESGIKKRKKKASSGQSAEQQGNDQKTLPKQYRPVLHFMSQSRFEQGLEDGLIVSSDSQEELPPWFDGATVNDLQAYTEPRASRKKSHSERIDQMLVHLWPLVQNIDQVLAADLPDAAINAHAKKCQPRQHETRLRTAFFAYVCFGFSRWALHYPVQRIGCWDRMGREKKFGRHSVVNGTHHGYGSNDLDMIQKILEGYRKFAGHGQHMSNIYRRAMLTVFGCAVQTDPRGRKYFIHPAGSPFPTFCQFRYRVAQEFPLAVRQTYKYGHTRVRTRLQHSQGTFFESAGNLMERTEEDGYYLDQVAKGYLPDSHLPRMCVVRTRCLASGMLVGIGFSIGGEAASAYRMAKFCEAIDKVKFCSLFGVTIKRDEWASSGVSPHVINDRGPGSTVKADSAAPIFRPVIKECAPSYAGQSKASIETSHPKQVKLEGKPHYVETRLSIPQLAVQEIMRTISDNNRIDVSTRLNNDAIAERVAPTPAGIWNYLDQRGRNYAVPMSFESAVRAYLTPIELTVKDDAAYFREQRFDSEALRQSGVLQRAHTSGVFRVTGYMLDVCVRHLWIDLGAGLIEVDAMLAIRDGEEQLYISVAELEQLEQLRRNARISHQSHQIAASAEYEVRFEELTGMPFEQGVLKGGRNKRSKPSSVQERQEVIDYLRAKGGRR